VARSWPGGDKRIGGRASHHEASEAMGSFLLPYAATGVSLLAVGGRSGATPRRQPWTSAVTLPHGCKGLSARRDGGVVDVSRALSGSPSAPRINMQRVARSDPYNVHHCLPSKKFVERYSRFKSRTHIGLHHTEPAPYSLQKKSYFAVFMECRLLSLSASRV